MLKRAAAIASLIIFTFIFSLDAGASSSDQSAIIGELRNTLTLASSGHILVNATVTVINNGTSAAQLPPLLLTYPRGYGGGFGGRIYTAGTSPVKASLLSGSREAGNFTAIMVDAGGISLQPRANSSFSVWFYLQGVVSDKGGVFALPFSRPGFSLFVSKMISELVLPAGVKPTQKGVFQEEVSTGALTKLVNATGKIPPGPPRPFDVELSADAASDFALLLFPSFSRTIVVSPDGAMVLREKLEIHNIGKKELGAIKLQLLNPRVEQIFVPPPPEPIAGYSATPRLFGGKLNLKGELNKVVEGGGSFILTYEYPLPAESYSPSVFTARIKLPVRPPIEGVVRTVILEFGLSEGFGAQVTLSPGFAPIGSKSYVFHNASQFDRDPQLQASIEPRLAAASSAVAPATLAFLAILSFAAITLPKRRAEKIVDAAMDLSEVVEEKILLADELTSLYNSRRDEKVDRREFEERKAGLQSRRTASSTRLGQLRTSLSARFPTLQAEFASLAGLDREYERALRDLWGLYEQLFLGRLKRETFDKQAPGVVRRAERNQGELMASLERLKKIAAEGG